ncbi:MAG: hypothetical protein AB8F74_01065 [Saprospiraceae bacterium]
MKKKNYNWKLNPDKPSKEQIASSMDFDKVLNEYNNSAPQEPGKPERAPRLRRRLRIIGGAIAAAIVGVIAFFSLNKNVSNNSPTTFKEYAVTQPYVNPPLGDEATKAFVNKTLSANEGGVFEFDNGSKLTVPPAAFTHAQGGIVQGDVEIRFREYHDFVDFFLSGIPMEYDSAGTQYNLESAGMVEIIAEQNGERLSMAPGKAIDVELVSNVITENGEVPNFNIYYLDQDKRNWVYEGLDKINRIDEPIADASDLLSEEEVIEQDYKNELAKIESKTQQKLASIERELPSLVKPYQPQKANGSGQVFDFSFGQDQIDYGTKVPGSEEEQLRLADEQIRKLRKQYANTMWQFSPNNEAVSETVIKNNEWEDMEMKFIGGRDYELTLIDGDKRVKVLINPVLIGQDYNKALASFNEEMKGYQAQLEERKSFMATKLSELRAAAAEEERIAQLAFEDKVAAYREKGLAHRATDEIIYAKVMNNFTATRLGIWNCDRPLPIGMLAINGSFKGSKDQEYHQNIAYVVNKSQNTISRFFTREGCKMDLRGNSEILIWLLTEDNKLAVHPPEKFEEVKKKKKTGSQDRFAHTFVMDVVDQPLDSEEDIRKVLDF